MKEQEAKGFQYESAEASFELLVRRAVGGYRPPFHLEDFLIVERRHHLRGEGENEMLAEAMAKVSVGETLTRTAAEGNGPVSALDAAVRSALSESFPEGENEMLAEAMAKVSVGETLTRTAAEGNGPVSALDAAVRSALSESFPDLERVHLVDYKVRIINPDGGADAAVRVLIESTDGVRLWRTTTVGASTDVVEASWLALQDAYEYWLLHHSEAGVSA